MLATLDGIEFGDDLTYTYVLEPDGLAGWFSGVGSRHASTPRPNGDGEFDAPTRLSARIITVTGSIMTDNAVDFENAIMALEDLLADGSMSEFTVEQATGTYGVDVRRHDAPDIIIEKYGELARFQLQFWAPNPTKVLIP